MSTGTRARFRMEWLHGKVAGWVILAFSVIITILAWHTANVYQEQRARERFAFTVEDAKWSILKRMREYEQVLRGGQGLFHAVSQVSRDDWRRYVATLQIETYWPGIQGIGFSHLFAPERKAGLIEEIRSQGFADFAVHPGGERAQYSAILYLEPFTGRNLRAFGYDMWSEPVRRAAMEQARDSGQPALSGPVTLVQETEQDVQQGVLMYLPVYRTGMPVDTLEARRQALLGFVYSPFRMRDLMEGILGHGVPDLDFELYDGDRPDATHRLHTTRASVVKTSSQAARFNRESRLELPGGRIWLAHFSSRPAFEREVESWQPLIIALLGMLIDLLLFLIVLSLSGQKERVQQQAEEIASELNRAEKRYRQMVENVKDIIFQTDAEGHWSFLNPAWEEISGYTVEESLGRPFLHHVHPDDRERFLDQFSRLMRGELHYIQDEYRGVRGNGDLVWVEVYLSVITDTHGTPIGSSGVVRDVTIRKQVEMVMLRARDAAESANRAKSEFLANMSHELRSPLNSVLILSKLLSRDDNLTSEQLESLRVIQESGRDLLNMINDILDLSKIEAGRMELTAETVPLARFAREILDPFRAIARNKGIELSSELTNDLPDTFICDGAKLKQILTNFLSNAVKFTESGSVTLKIRRAEQHAHPAHGSQNVLCFQVADTGIGIPGDKQELIFESFRQLDGAMSRKYGGTGLGLSIARKLTEILHGVIEVESREGVGSCFKLTLPELDRPLLPLLRTQEASIWDDAEGSFERERGEEAYAHTDTPTPGPEVVEPPKPFLIDGQPVTVLVVDDDMRMAFSIASGLQKRVEHVLLAANGARAMQEIAAHPEIRAIVLDIRMPEMDGLETMRVLRANPRHADLAILVLTANVLPDDEAHCLAAGADAYLGKPAPMEVIWAKLEEIMQKHAQCVSQNISPHDKS
ncbi:MAG: CHASE domain-containing protein [Magnetococcus sp. YQC-9]